MTNNYFKELLVKVFTLKSSITAISETVKCPFKLLAHKNKLCDF